MSQTESKPSWRRDLEGRAKAGDEAVVELAALKRTLVFRDADINPSSKKNEYFIKGYDGDLTVDAIRDEATAVGLYDNAGAPAEQQINMGAEQRIAAAADEMLQNRTETRFSISFTSWMCFSTNCCLRLVCVELS